MHEDETTQLPTTIVPEPPTGPANGKTVLIAEDDPFIARMYDVKLRSEGYAVVLRNNGREAYEAIKLQRPDLIMLDLNMPELTGQELLADRVRQRAALHRPLHQRKNACLVEQLGR